MAQVVGPRLNHEIQLASNAVERGKNLFKASCKYGEDQYTWFSLAEAKSFRS